MERPSRSQSIAERKGIGAHTLQALRSCDRLESLGIGLPEAALRAALVAESEFARDVLESAIQGELPVDGAIVVVQQCIDRIRVIHEAIKAQRESL